MPSAGACKAPQLDPAEADSGMAVSLGVVKASGSSAFSPLTCFWFRSLQTNQLQLQSPKLPYSNPPFFFPCPACPHDGGQTTPRAAEDKAGNVQRGASSGMSFLLPFAPPPHIMAKNSDSRCNWAAFSEAELYVQVGGMFCFVYI